MNLPFFWWLYLSRQYPSSVLAGGLQANVGAGGGTLSVDVLSVAVQSGSNMSQARRFREVMSQDLLRQLIHQGAQFRKLVSEITTRIKELEEMVVSQFTRIQTLEAELRQYRVANAAMDRLYEPQAKEPAE